MRARDQRKSERRGARVSSTKLDRDRRRRERNSFREQFPAGQLPGILFAWQIAGITDIPSRDAIRIPLYRGNAFISFIYEFPASDHFVSPMRFRLFTRKRFSLRELSRRGEFSFFFSLTVCTNFMYAPLRSYDSIGG